MADIELVVFDLAGTTVNDEDGVNGCIRAALDAVGLAVMPAEVNRVMGLRKPEAIARLIDSHGQSPDLGPRVDEIHRDFVRRATEYYTTDPSVREIDGVSEVFDRMRGEGRRVALNTGFDRVIVEVILSRMGWGDRVNTSIASDEVDRGRPHPDMIHELMRRFAIEDPARVAKVGDTPVDLEEGTNAGCGLVVGVTSGAHSREELEAFPHTHLLETIRHLPELLSVTRASAR